MFPDTFDFSQGHVTKNQPMVNFVFPRVLMFPDTFDFSQGHVTKNQPIAVPV